MNNRFAMLFTPLKIGGLEVKNRVVMAPMTTGFPDRDGYVTQNLIDYYLKRAEGGVGLITVESCYVDRGGKGFIGQLALDDDRYIPELARLARCVKETGARVVLQLIHCGRQTSSAICGSQPVAPSPIPCPVIREMPRELATHEVEDIIQAFVGAAKRAREAGFDAVEIHAAHGYLVNQFLSPYSNKRSDKYGGSLFNRSKMARDIVGKVKALVGRGYPVLCRLSADEFVEGGLTLSDTRQVAGWLENLGVDAVSVSGGVYETADRILPTMDVEPGSLVHLAQGIKDSVGIPVFAVGGISDPAFAEQILVQGKADMVVLGRALLADPEWAIKAERGEGHRIRPCIYCNHCRNRAIRPKMNCAVNYETGRETDLSPRHKASKPKNVVVIGGGISGLEAAYISALRGHKVALYEQAQELGGNLLLAGVPPKRERLRRIILFLENELKGLGIPIFLNSKATMELVRQLKPDVLFIATGTQAIVPDVPGIDGPNVFSAGEVLKGTVEVGKYVVVMGGGLVGLETADYLRERGKAVTIVEKLPGVGTDARVEAIFLRHLLARLKRTDESVLVLTSTEIKEIGPNYVKVTQNSVDKQLSGIDSVVVAVGLKSFLPIEPEHFGDECEVHVIGDAMKPQTLFEAIHTAAEAAYSI